MNKSDKKLDNQICKALTLACETAKLEVHGFQWLTHLVDYKKFPESLSVICIFDTNSSLIDARKGMKNQFISSLIDNHFKKTNITIQNIIGHIKYDTEEACHLENNGDWKVRFKLTKP